MDSDIFVAAEEVYNNYCKTPCTNIKRKVRWAEPVEAVIPNATSARKRPAVRHHAVTVAVDCFADDGKRNSILASDSNTFIPVMMPGSLMYGRDDNDHSDDDDIDDCGLCYLESDPESPVDSDGEETPDKLKFFTALADFNSKVPWDLAFRASDIVEVFTAGAGKWWEAKSVRTGDIGMVPSNFFRRHGLEAEPWYFGGINRQMAEWLLRQEVNEVGAFLVRHRDTEMSEWAVSVKTKDSAADHFLIRVTSGGRFFVAERRGGRKFQSIRQLVDHLVALEDMLTVPCAFREETKKLAYVEPDEWWKNHKGRAHA